VHIWKRLAALETRVDALETAGNPKPAATETITDAQGIDVYWRTGSMDWAAVRADGCEFAILKATEGEGYLDDPKKRKWFIGQSKGAHAAGLAVMYYHFARLDTGADPIKDARAEAIDFLDAIALVEAPAVVEFQPGRLASVWLDLEATADNLTPAEGLAWCLDFVETVEAGGVLCGIYSSSRYLKKEVGADLTVLMRRADGTERAGWWARYGLNVGTIPDAAKYPIDAKVAEAWGTHDLWQYGSKVATAGVPGVGDRNIAPRFKVIS
jgi:GH25 family lysozyme M1 (1,4-beta-N-acetylmuramidase)